MLRKVTVKNGVIEGLPAADPRITVFRGIPFAAPPTGENRWRAPQPAKNWDGVLKAYRFGPAAMQETPGLNPDDIYTREWHVDSSVPVSEDCLQLNIWTPAKCADEKLPVMVWIYGGGLCVGYPSEMEIDGERLARRGVILVSINYRLNVFGFLSHPEITAENPEKAANFGHWDQKAGIEWVKENIAAFGGDPGNITVFGQSAGGGSTMVQLTTPLNKGLFQKAIVQSAAGLLAPCVDNLSLAEGEKMGVKFFEYLGVKSLAEARHVDAATLLAKGLEFTSVYRWDSVIDGTLIPNFPPYAILSGRANDVALMLGNTEDEFHVAPKVTTEAELEAYAAEKFGKYAPRYLDICKKDGDNLDTMIKNGTYNRFEIGNLLWADANARRGAPKTYLYSFDPEIPGFDDPGAFHSSELWFVFETLAKCWRPFKGRHYDLARQMCNYWTNFAKTGDPNGEDADGTPMPEWTEFTKESPYAMSFTDEARMDLTPRSEMKSFAVEYFESRLESRDIFGYFPIKKLIVNK